MIANHFTSFEGQRVVVIGASSGIGLQRSPSVFEKGANPPQPQVLYEMICGIRQSGSSQKSSAKMPARFREGVSTR